jgi:hypothetical protein
MTTRFLAPLMTLFVSLPAEARGQRAPPPPIPATYRFEADVLVETHRDENRDGRPDAWCYYERGRLARFEADRDHDGKPDWRETWDAADARPWLGSLTVRQIDGRWRIVPVQEGWGPPTPWREYPGLTEKLVDNAWTGTFTDQRELTFETDDDRVGKPTVRRVQQAWRYEAGKPVELRSPGQHVRWKDGRIVYSEYRDDRRWLVTEPGDGGRLATTERTPDGTPVSRWSGAAYELWRDGKWVDTFVEESKDAQGAVNGRKTYERRRLVSSEQVDPRTGVVFRRHRHAADGTWVDEQMEHDGRPNLREFVAADGTRTRVERFVDGRWTADFVQESPYGRLTYAGGRLTRFEHRSVPGTEVTLVKAFPDADHEQIGDARGTHTWLTYAPAEPGRVRWLAREERDLDRDGRVVLKADYERLTVEQP